MTDDDEFWSTFEAIDALSLPNAETLKTLVKDIAKGLLRAVEVPCFTREAGFLLLMPYLHTNKSVIHIDAFGQCLGRKSALAIAELLAKTTTLESIDLHCNFFDDFSVEILISAMEKNVTLRDVSLSMNRYGVDGCLRISRFLETNTRLIRVSYDASYVARIDTKRSVDSVATMIRKNKTLRHLDVTILREETTVSTLERALATNLSIIVGFKLPRLALLLQRNQHLRWSTVHPLLLHICVPLISLRLPVYVILWIIDWLPTFHPVRLAHKTGARYIGKVMSDTEVYTYDEQISCLWLLPEIKKVRLIEGLTQSCRKVWAAREANAKKE